MSKPSNILNILVTRPVHQAETLCELIEQQGWNAIRFPTLAIIAINNTKKIQQQIEAIKQWHWLIFISPNAVNFALNANSGRIDLFEHSSIAAVGKATKSALLAAGLSVDLLPENQFNSEGLLATEQMNQVNKKNCLIIRGQGGRETLADELRARGAKVDYLEVYSRETPTPDCSKVTSILKQDKLHAITITSGNALKNLVSMIDTDLHNELQAVPLVVISNRIRELAEKIGFKIIAVTENPGDTAIIKTVTMMNLRVQT